MHDDDNVRDQLHLFIEEECAIDDNDNLIDIDSDDDEHRYHHHDDDHHDNHNHFLISEGCTNLIDHHDHLLVIKECAKEENDGLNDIDSDDNYHDDDYDHDGDHDDRDNLDHDCGDHDHHHHHLLILEECAIEDDDDHDHHHHRHHRHHQHDHHHHLLILEECATMCHHGHHRLQEGCHDKASQEGGDKEDTSHKLNFARVRLKISSFATRVSSRLHVIEENAWTKLDGTVLTNREGG